MNDGWRDGPEQFRWQDFKGIDPNGRGFRPVMRGGFFSHLRRMFSSLLRLAVRYQEERD